MDSKFHKKVQDSFANKTDDAAFEKWWAEIGTVLMGDPKRLAYAAWNAGKGPPEDLESDEG